MKILPLEVFTQHSERLFKILSSFQPEVLSILRIFVAYSYMIHGSSKAFGIPVDMTSYITSWSSLVGVSAVLEIVGGFLLLIGFQTRPIAFLLSGHMAAAYFIAHPSFFPLANKGEAAALFSFIFLYLSTAGGGSWSLDFLISGK